MLHRVLCRVPRDPMTGPADPMGGSDDALGGFTSLDHQSGVASMDARFHIRRTTSATAARSAEVVMASPQHRDLGNRRGTGGLQ